MKSTLALAVGALLVGVGPHLASAGDDDRLLKAAKQRNIDGVRALLKAGTNVNAEQPDGATALHWAAHWDDVAMADVLLRAGARVNQANEYGATPLWLASLNGSGAMVRKLLDSGADPNMALHFGETPVFAAARVGAMQVVQALLAKGGKPDVTEPAQGQTPLMWAAAEGHVDVMRALIEGGAQVEHQSKSGFTPLMFVARQGSVAAARLLLDRGAGINAQSKDGATPLLIAVMRGHVDLAELLLERRADPNLTGTGYTALHWAAGAWETTITHYQFTDGEWAAMAGLPSPDAKARVIKALVAHGADVNATTLREPPRAGFTMVSAAGPFELRQNMTPFYIAAMAADSVVMRLLVSLGADPNITSANKTTPLMVAAGRVRMDYETRIREEDALAAVKQAQAFGNDIHAINNDGETALHAAAMVGFNSVVEYLVAHGVSLTARSKDGKTALALADGYPLAGQVIQRPSTAALLRKLGASQ